MRVNEVARISPTGADETSPVPVLGGRGAIRDGVAGIDVLVGWDGSGVFVAGMGNVGVSTTGGGGHGTVAVATLTMLRLNSPTLR